MAGITATPHNLGGAAIPFYEYGIDYSCRFNDDDSADTQTGAATAMDDNKLFSLSFWVKRANITSRQVILSGGADADNVTLIEFNASDKLRWAHRDAAANTDEMISTMLFRDVTNWYHIFIVYDSADGTAGDRQKVWVNGTEVTVWDTDNNPAQNATCDLGGSNLNIGSLVTNASYLDGYLAEMYFIDGTAESVGTYGKSKNGVWVPVLASPTYGSAGFKLDMAVAPGTGNGAGTDVSGNANHFTDTNLAANDQVLDTPTENYPTLNVLDKSLSGMTLAEGNLKGSAGAAQDGVRGTQAIPTSGKWYFEMTCSNTGWYGGICNQDFTLDGDTGDDADACTFLDNSTVAYVEAANQVGYWAAAPAGNVVGVCVNMDDLEIHFTNAAEGEQANVAFGATAGDIWFPYGGGNSDNATFDFGQSGFTLTLPAGYKALNTTNIVAANAYPTDIMNPTSGFETVLYAGDDGATQAITGANHQPDLVWIKNRDNADAYYLCDSVRGVTIYLSCDVPDAEVTDANDGISSFDADGFTVMFNAIDIVNANGENYVAWCWKEDPIYGFDIVSFAGTGVAHAENHNLGAAPELIIVKNRDTAATNWATYHWAALNKTDPETDYGYLDVNQAWNDAATLWNDTAPTSTQFTVGTSSLVNENTKNIIVYLFRSIEGYSKVFTYEGNGNADGPFVYCGFRPKMIITKNADMADGWIIEDTVRTVYNQVDDYLRIDFNQAEDTAGENEIDFLSNGFKLRCTDHTANENAKTYVGVCFAEMPGVYGNAR